MVDIVISPDDVNPNNIAAPWWFAGCSVIPIKWDGSKAPIFSWREYQRERVDLGQLRTWFERRYPMAGVAVICGQISGNLEMLELEGRAHNQAVIDQITAACQHHLVADLWWRLLNNGYTELTPSGGLHILYRVTDNSIPGNDRIASRPATEEEFTPQDRATKERQPSYTPIRVLAETRGEGGYVIVAPSSGDCHQSGQPWVTLTGSPQEILNITWDERNRLHAAIREALHIPVPGTDIATIPASPSPIPPRPLGAPLSVAEDFNTRSSWQDNWFTDQGWTEHHREGGEVFWTRPGKELDEGHSATTGYRQGEADCLYVWSTSTTLPAERPLTKFQVFSHYRFNGDMSAAARYLQQQGYGAPVAPPADFVELDLDAPVGDNPVVERHHDDEEPSRYRLLDLVNDLSGGTVLTDTGYAQRMRDQYRNSFRYNSTDKCWYVWQPGIGLWTKDDYSQVDSIAQRISQETFNWLKRYLGENIGGINEKPIRDLLKQAQKGLDNSRLQAIVSRFKTLRPIASTSDGFDARSDYLNLRNGTLDLGTFELRPHDARDMVTLSCNASYNPNSDCNDFEKYIFEAIPDDALRKYIQRAIGYSLLGNPVERAMFLLHGPSGTGKSVFTDTMTHLFGDYGVTAPSSTFKLKKQEGTFDLHRLKGKRFVTTSEMPEGAQLDEELVKRFTGGDIIPSRGLYEKYQDWRPQGVVWIATNFLPKLNGDDNAIWRRVRTIPMQNEVAIGQEVKGLSRQLQQEADGILNWALEGLREYRSIGLAEPETVILDIAEYRTNTDSVASWLAYNLEDGGWVLDPDARTPLTTAYANYVSNCQENGIPHLGKQRFVKRLNSVNSSIHVNRSRGQTTILGIKPTASLPPVHQPGKLAAF